MLSTKFTFAPTDNIASLKSKTIADIIPASQELVSVWTSYRVSALLKYG